MSGLLKPESNLTVRGGVAELTVYIFPGDDPERDMTMDEHVMWEAGYGLYRMGRSRGFIARRVRAFDQQILREENATE